MANYVEISGHRIVECTIYLPYAGAWWADCLFESDPDLPSDKLELHFGELTLVGTVRESVSYGEQKQIRLLAGAGAWGQPLPALAYPRNDAGIKAVTIAQDLANGVGETLGSFDPSRERLGAWFVRRFGPAGETLDAVIGTDRIWWTDLDGSTIVAASRPAPVAEISDYQVVSVEHSLSVAQLSLEDASNVLPGARLQLPESGTVEAKDVTLKLSGNSFTASVWFGPRPEKRGRLADALQRIISRTSDKQILGVYRYRVLQMSGDNIDLQRISSVDGLPDLTSVPQRPGIGGAHTLPAPGSEVLVQFIAGDRAQPYICAYEGRGPNHVPGGLILGSADNDAPEAARKGDTGTTLLPPAIFSGTIGGQPATGVLSFPTGSTLTVIDTGSSKVKIGT